MERYFFFGHEVAGLLIGASMKDYGALVVQQPDFAPGNKFAWHIFCLTFKR